MELFISVLFALGLLTGDRNSSLEKILENKEAIEKYSINTYGKSSSEFLKVNKDDKGNWYVPWDADELISK
jgi:hypothetical protein